MGSIPQSGRSPGGGHGNPLQYSCLDNPMDRGSWGRKELDIISIAAAGTFLYSFKCVYSLLAQMVKNPPAMQETWVQSLGREDPLEKGMSAYPFQQNSMDGGTWWATVHEVTKSQTELTLNILSKRICKKLLKFWYFVFCFILCCRSPTKLVIQHGKENAFLYINLLSEHYFLP